MRKTIEELLFIQMMHLQYYIRKNMAGHEALGPDPEGHGHGGHGSEGHGFPGHGPEGHGFPGHGHEGHGFPGHGPEGHGFPGHGPGPGHRRHFNREHILNIIDEHEDGIRQKDIAYKLGIKPSSMSELIGKLENDGYVARTIDPSDKRATLITLTELGQARAAEVEDEKNAGFKQLFSRLTQEEKEQLYNLINKMTGSQSFPDPED